MEHHRKENNNNNIKTNSSLKNSLPKYMSSNKDKNYLLKNSYNIIKNDDTHYYTRKEIISNEKNLDHIKQVDGNCKLVENINVYDDGANIGRANGDDDKDCDVDNDDDKNDRKCNNILCDNNNNEEKINNKLTNTSTIDKIDELSITKNVMDKNKQDINVMKGENIVKNQYNGINNELELSLNKDDKNNDYPSYKKEINNYNNNDNDNISFNASEHIYEEKDNAKKVPVPLSGNTLLIDTNSSSSSNEKNDIKDLKIDEYNTENNNLNLKYNEENGKIDNTNSEYLSKEYTVVDGSNNVVDTIDNDYSKRNKCRHNQENIENSKEYNITENNQNIKMEKSERNKNNVDEKSILPISQIFENLLRIKKQVNLLKVKKEQNKLKIWKKESRKKRKVKYRFEKDKFGIFDFIMVCKSEFIGFKKCESLGLQLQSIVVDEKLIYNFVCPNHKACVGSFLVKVDMNNNNIEIKARGPICVNFNELFDEKKKNTGNRFKWEYLDVCVNIQEGKDRATAMGYKYLNSSVTGKRYVRNFVCILNSHCNSRLRIIKDNETNKVWLELSGLNHEEHCPYSPHSSEGMFLNNKKNRKTLIHKNHNKLINHDNILGSLNSSNNYNNININYHSICNNINNYNTYNNIQNGNYTFSNVHNANYNNINNTYSNINSSNNPYNDKYNNNLNNKNPVYVAYNNYDNDLKIKGMAAYASNFNKNMNIPDPSYNLISNNNDNSMNNQLYIFPKVSNTNCMNNASKLILKRSMLCNQNNNCNDINSSSSSSNNNNNSENVLFPASLKNAYKCSSLYRGSDNIDNMNFVNKKNFIRNLLLNSQENNFVINNIYNNNTINNSFNNYVPSCSILNNYNNNLNGNALTNDYNIDPNNNENNKNIVADTNNSNNNNHRNQNNNENNNPNNNNNYNKKSSSNNNNKNVCNILINNNSISDMNKNNCYTMENKENNIPKYLYNNSNYVNATDLSKNEFHHNNMNSSHFLCAPVLLPSNSSNNINFNLRNYNVQNLNVLPNIGIENNALCTFPNYDKMKNASERMMLDDFSKIGNTFNNNHSSSNEKEASNYIYNKHNPTNYHNTLMNTTNVVRICNNDNIIFKEIQNNIKNEIYHHSSNNTFNYLWNNTNNLTIPNGIVTNNRLLSNSSSINKKNLEAYSDQSNNNINNNVNNNNNINSSNKKVLKHIIMNTSKKNEKSCINEENPNINYQKQFKGNHYEKIKNKNQEKLKQNANELKNDEKENSIEEDEEENENMCEQKRVIGNTIVEYKNRSENKNLNADVNEFENRNINEDEIEMENNKIINKNCNNEKVSDGENNQADEYNSEDENYEEEEEYEEEKDADNRVKRNHKEDKNKTNIAKTHDKEVYKEDHERNRKSEYKCNEIIKNYDDSKESHNYLYYERMKNNQNIIDNKNKEIKEKSFSQEKGNSVICKQRSSKEEFFENSENYLNGIKKNGTNERNLQDIQNDRMRAVYGNSFSNTQSSVIENFANRKNNDYLKEDKEIYEKNNEKKRKLVNNYNESDVLLGNSNFEYNSSVVDPTNNQEYMFPSQFLKYLKFHKYNNPMNTKNNVINSINENINNLNNHNSTVIRKNENLNQSNVPNNRSNLSDHSTNGIDSESFENNTSSSMGICRKNTISLVNSNSLNNYTTANHDLNESKLTYNNAIIDSSKGMYNSLNCIHQNSKNSDEFNFYNSINENIQNNSNKGDENCNIILRCNTDPVINYEKNIFNENRNSDNNENIENRKFCKGNNSDFRDNHHHLENSNEKEDNNLTTREILSNKLENPISDFNCSYGYNTCIQHNNTEAFIVPTYSSSLDMNNTNENNNAGITVNYNNIPNSTNSTYANNYYATNYLNVVDNGNYTKNSVYIPLHNLNISNNASQSTHLNNFSNLNRVNSLNNLSSISSLNNNEILNSEIRNNYKNDLSCSYNNNNSNTTPTNATTTTNNNYLVTNYENNYQLNTSNPNHIYDLNNCNLGSIDSQNNFFNQNY